MTDHSSAVVEEAARLLAAYDANTSNGAVALQAAAPRIIRALLASRQPLREREEPKTFPWAAIEYAVGYCCGKDRVNDVWEAMQEYANASVPVLRDETQKDQD
jgi:hypothetical protein